MAGPIRTKEVRNICMYMQEVRNVCMYMRTRTMTVITSCVGMVCKS